MTRALLVIAAVLVLLVLYLNGSVYYLMVQHNVRVEFLQPPNNPLDAGNPPANPNIQPPYRKD